ncbi:hypothetical protein BOTBODRAFT_182391 [Botryobasidium botryosum FD-172 SS1]|uniref:F-box domain-containing protein n=1 Tax=Botryobasidium botryosum (strain FD-172 SS1) TaxID=930990 RepID=A0A067LQV6_BOTB1|nr:hypothetical protein BOTBODRAFT_182391 [Botryobasidium botryosum FD-172 SS1]
MEHAAKILPQKSLRLLNELMDSVKDEGTTTVEQSLSVVQLQRIWEAEARFRSISDAMLYEAARFCTKANQLASINATLPNEVLVYIFELGALEDIEDNSYLPLFSRTVSHVCRLWRGISLASPALWTLYHPQLPPDFTSRTKESLLDFVIQPHIIRATSEPSDIPAFGRQLIKARSLWLTTSKMVRQEGLELEFMCSPAPHLATLSVYFPRRQLQRIWEAEARFRSISDAMLYEAARFCTKANQLASINATLPNEVLVYIFELGALEDIEDNSYLPLFSRTVSHVCRLWRGISLASPALWTLYHPQLPPDFTSRTKESLLDFVIQPHIIRATSEPSDIPAFGRQLIKARSLWLTTSKMVRQEGLELEFMCSPAPHLATLSVYFPRRWVDYIRLPGQLFAGQHSISRISIRNIGVPWNISILSCLRVLELREIPRRGCITMPELMSVLRSSPQLQVLRLDHTGPIFIPGQHQQMEAAVLLALRSFHWVDPSSSSATKALLRGIITRRTARIRLRVAISDEVEGLMREGEDHSTGDTITLLQAISSFPRALALSRERRETPQIYHILKYDSDTADRISIFFSLHAFPLDHRFLLSNLANCSLSQVQSIALTEMSMDDTDLFVQILHALPNITAISLDSCSCDDGLIRALADQRWTHRVEDVSFSSSDILPETTLDFAHSRVASSQSPDLCGLMPLRRLSFKECGNILDETLESLRALVPEVVRCQTRVQG